MSTEVPCCAVKQANFTGLLGNGDPAVAADGARAESGHGGAGGQRGKSQANTGSANSSHGRTVVPGHERAPVRWSQGGNRAQWSAGGVRPVQGFVGIPG